MASQSLRDDFAVTVELYSTFIKKLNAENPQLNVFEVSFTHGKASKNSYGKRHSTGISNVSNAKVDDRFLLNSRSPSCARAHTHRQARAL
jgi:hypothetical protein